MMNMNPDFYSLDFSIQSCLSGLYLPFEATAPTVLSQLFDLIEAHYGGDSLRCLIDFLIPARQLLERVQQAACASYSDVIFRCEGWPLCLHDRIVIHLAPIDPRLLSSGDFYLQVVPAREQEVRIVVRSLAEKGQHDLEEIPIPETLYCRIFTEDWLRELNVDKHGRSLSCCVLATEQSFIKVPWDQVANPEFVDELLRMESKNRPYKQGSPGQPGYSVETRICPAKDGIAVSLCLVDTSRKSSMDQTMPGMRQVGWVSANTWDSRSENCFVGKDVNHIQEMEAVRNCRTSGQPSNSQRPNRVMPPSLVSDSPAAPDRPTCVRTVRFAEQPCTPCLRRKHGQGSTNQECRYKESYKTNQSYGEKRQQEPNLPERSARKDSRTLHRPNRKQCPQAQTNDSQGTVVDLTNQGEETITCLTPTVLGTSEKCHIVSQDFHGSPSEGSRDSCTEMIPRLHVVRGRKTTTFGLVSPKLNRRMPPKQGGTDRSCRAVVEVSGDHQHWMSSVFSSAEISNLLLYFYTIIRKEIRELGMMLVYDGREAALHPKLTEALQTLQEHHPRVIHRVIILINKERSHNHKKYPADMEVVTSLKGLHKYIDCTQLSPALDGTFPYSQRDWLQLHQELYPFVFDLNKATNLLLDAIRSVEGIHKIHTAQDVQQCIHEQRALMKDVLEDARLVTLQREGRALLARLRWESDVRSTRFEASREVLDTVDSLYNQLEETVHVLVRRSNMSFQQLDFLLQLREMESRFTEIKEWFEVEGERRILEAESVKEPSERIQETLQCLSNVLAEANEHMIQAMRLATKAESIHGPDYPETEGFHSLVSTFKSNLSDFLRQAKQYCDHLETMVHLCHFCEHATEVARDCSQELEQDRLQSMTQQEKWATLQRCHEKLSEFSPEHFQEAKAQACSLHTSMGMQVWNMTWRRCQEVSRQLEDILQELERARQQPEPVPYPYRCHGDGEGSAAEVSAEDAPVLRRHDVRRNSLGGADTKSRPERDSIYGTVSCFNINFRQSRKGRKGTKATTVPDQDQNARKTSKEHGQKAAEVPHTAGCQWFPWQHTSPPNKKDSSSNRTQVHQSTSTEPQTSKSVCFNGHTLEPTCAGAVPQNPVPSCLPSSAQQTPIHHQYPHPDAFFSEARLSGRTSRSEETLSWGSEGTNALSNPSTASNTMKLERIMEELLFTEMEYVRSLGYVLTHYLPLLARPDVPPDLRGQRGRIFGNLEKLYDFHCHYFVQELEDCRTEPLMVGRCFLRHKENFGLYALYSKNKPQSDALVRQHKFFKCKQKELDDSMDLSSYLLKPVQRISKYSLLLQEMLAECGAAQSQEGLEIQGAAEVVRFQLRHGNDLLTMDAIQGCDVNLQEQGQLIRQDEFYVMFRKKRALRRVFLFEELILFTKTKKTPRGDDVYVYKQSFKTCDIGLTPTCGQSGLCFEIWFRRRRIQDLYILQAERPDVKEAWTSDLQHILWDQALKNREMRRQELVLMGMSSKPLMNFQPAEPTNQNRTITHLLPGREIAAFLNSPNPSASRLRSDAALQRPESIGPGSRASTSGSQSSSSSGRGSLSPSGFHDNQVERRNRGVCGTQVPHGGDDEQSQNRLPGSGNVLP
ncbi:uncharacterized protein KIAA1755 homolog [Trichomycterus rosablanca]|uniref:uncharacterized protein KIAA1755 homolog n=1 Tax=Trichomycterus rosablanca TaxID=2290929 RepID=UPI002F35B87F